MPPKSRFFYGWWIVGVALAGECLGNGSLVTYTFTCFLKPLAREFGTNRGRTVLALSLTNLAVAVSAPIMGRLSDRFGVRRVVLAAIVGSVAAVIAISGMRPPLWHLYLAFVAAGLAGAGAGPVTYRRVVVNWFDRRRGLALGLASLGPGTWGALVMPLLAQALIDRLGWRRAYLALALTALGVVFPLIALFFKERPEELGLRADGADQAPDPRHGSRPDPARAGRRHEPGLAAAADARPSLAALFHFRGGGRLRGRRLAPSGRPADRSRNHSRARRGHRLALRTRHAGRTGGDGGVDRPDVRPAGDGGLFRRFDTLGLFILRQGAGGWAPAAGALLLGLGVGAETDVMPYLVSRYFGLRAMGAIFGCAFSAHVLGVAIGGYFLGAGLRRRADPYRRPLAAAIGLMAPLGRRATFHRYERPFGRVRPRPRRKAGRRDIRTSIRPRL